MKLLAQVAAAFVALMLVAFLGIVTLILSEEGAEATETASGTGLRGVPEAFRPWILKAEAECPHPELTGALLAAQLAQESGFNARRGKGGALSDKGAQGPAQFIPSTWATYGYDADNNGESTPWDIGDAVMAQGRFMCSLTGTAKSSGFPGDIRALALAGYNAGWGAVERYRGVPPIEFARRPGKAEGETYHYVRVIMAAIPKYQGPALVTVSGSGAGARAVRKALARLGTPYSWGGGSPQGPGPGFCDGTNGYDKKTGRCSASRTHGFDCSSLVQYAYWGSLKLPRTAAPQYGATSHRPVSRSDLRVGDLLFWSKSGSGAIYHVALYAGDGNVVHAPRTGKNVELVPLTSAMPERDYYGATRP
ncbi:bifunctional lytic transglycosylase/C40 family peptidase [Streptomyces tsukubensis]|uniref:C40 family peptidase n=1 Tax=Streptomyces tsukubensis TaxID=83656 RepID=UPI00344F24BE